MIKQSLISLIAVLGLAGTANAITYTIKNDIPATSPKTTFHYYNPPFTSSALIEPGLTATVNTSKALLVNTVVGRSEQAVMARGKQTGITYCSYSLRTVVPNITYSTMIKGACQTFKTAVPPTPPPGPQV